MAKRRRKAKRAKAQAGAPPAGDAAGPSVGVLTDSHHTRGDLRLIRRAARGRWPIKDEMRDALPGLVFDIAKDKDQDARTRVGAAATLVRMDDANQRDEHKGAEFERLDAGEATEHVEHSGHIRYVQMPEEEI